MSEFNKEVSSFFKKLKGDKELVTGDDKITILPSPETEKEKKDKQRIYYLSQYVRNKTYSRKHVEFYDEYRRMASTFPIIKAALDIYGEEATAKNNKGDVITIKTDNKKVKQLLEECYFKNLSINSKGYIYIREFCKFGNTYAYLITRPRIGVTGLELLPSDSIVREQLYNPENLSEYRFLWYGGGGNASFEPWEIVHWKNIEDAETSPYGSSILRPIVDTWRRVVLIREALVIYRITRAPNKLLFKIGSDGMSGEEAFKFAQEMKKEITKKPLVNPQTGEIDFKYNPMPLSINTPIPLLDGRSLTLGQLIEEFSQGKVNYVYSIQDNTNQIVPGKIQWVGKNYTANKLIRVWLDNESYVDSAPEHPFILRDGTIKRADELKEKDSLMPLYRKKEIVYKDTEYDMVYNPVSDQYEFTHQLIAKEVEDPKEFKTRHHKVSKIDVLENVQEDVCCMTIVGLNNENDRHNFAYYGKDIDGNIVESGTFVKNSVEENIFIPVTEGTNSDVSVLEGAGNLDAVEDYKIIKDDLFAGLKIPKSFLSFESDLSNKSSLCEEDIRFAKTIQRIQSEFIEGLLHIGLVHLYMNGCSMEEMQSFSIEMSNPSTGSEKRKWEIMSSKIDVALKLWSPDNVGLNLMSYVDVLKSIFKFTDEEITQTIRSQYNEKKISWRLKQLNENGFYEEPELDKLMAELKNVSGGINPEDTNVFNNLGFEGKTVTNILKKKIEGELLEMFGGNIEVAPKKEQILLIESNLKKNLQRVQDDLKF